MQYFMILFEFKREVHTHFCTSFKLCYNKTKLKFKQNISDGKDMYFFMIFYFLRIEGK